MPAAARGRYESELRSTSGQYSYITTVKFKRTLGSDDVNDREIVAGVRPVVYAFNGQGRDGLGLYHGPSRGFANVEFFPEPVGECPPGFSVSEELQLCVRCATDTFKPGTNTRTECDKCPAMSTTQTRLGSTHASNCSCNFGFVGTIRSPLDECEKRAARQPTHRPPPSTPNLRSIDIQATALLPEQVPLARAGGGRLPRR